MTNFTPSKMSASQYCAIVSIVCPLIAMGLSTLISYSHTDFWNGLDVNDDANRNAAVMMAAAEGGAIVICLAGGFLIGLGLSFFSLVRQRSGLGYIGLALNSAPFLLFFLVLFR